MKSGILFVALALMALYSQDQITQRSKVVDLNQTKVAGVEEGKAALRTFCLELAATEKQSRGQLSPGLMALRPLCSAVPNPDEIYVYACNGDKGSIAGSCAKDYDEAVKTGLPICGDLEHFCTALGAKWQQSAARKKP